MIGHAWVIFLLSAAALFSAVDYAALGDDTWAQLPLTGGVVSSAGDVHWACDTSGFAYMFGACSYGGQAGGTHNSDVYRFNLQTGAVTMLSNCANNTLGWTSGCQNGIAFDATRNCMWVDEIGGLSVCTGAYGGGFYKYQCPDGPLTRMAGGGGGTYLAYDNVNDLVYMPSAYTLKIYDCRTNTWKTAVNYPFPQPVNTWTVPCCFDSKRGLFVITLTGPYDITDPATQVVFDVWFYNGATSQWSKKTPPSHPALYELELAYDTVNDKYVYFGQGSDGVPRSVCNSQLWTYDYTANTWTQIQQNGRAYNDADNAASTWPPARHKHTWAYSPKYNACVNWGGGVWADAACTDYDNGAQPIWIYRLSRTGTGIDASTIRLTNQASFFAYPNPARDRVSFQLPGLDHQGVSERIVFYDIKGRQVAGFAQTGVSASWNASALPAGTYLARLTRGPAYFEQRLIIMK
jgi:hypothetical protein